MSGSVRGVPGDRYPYRDCRDCIAKVICLVAFPYFLVRAKAIFLSSLLARPSSFFFTTRE
jgi:hypothetical protein